MPVPPRPDVTATFSVDGVVYSATVPHDISVLRAIRDFTPRSDVPFRCESGICGTCEALMNGISTRLCGVGPRHLDGAEIFIQR